MKDDFVLSDGGIYIPSAVNEEVQSLWKQQYLNNPSTEWNVDKGDSDVAKFHVTTKGVKSHSVSMATIKALFPLLDNYLNKFVNSTGYTFESYSNPTNETDGSMPILFPDTRRLPDGDFTVEVIGSVYGRSTKENPMVTVEFEVVDGPKAGVTIKAFLLVRESGLAGWDSLLYACNIEAKSDISIHAPISSRLRITVADGWVRGFQKLKGN